MLEGQARVLAARSLLASMAMVAVAFIGCSDDADLGAVEFRVPVRAEEVSTGTVEDRIVATGTLRASQSAVLKVETRGALILARSGGRALAEGDRVSSGQIIAEVAGEDARLAARGEATEQRYRGAVKVLAARQRLFDEGLISEEELRNAESTLADAKIEFERSQLTEDRTRIVTPISGRILSLARGAGGLPVARGQLVDPGFTVAEIAPTENLIADVDLLGPDLPRARPGMEARVSHYAFDHDFEGSLVRLSPAVDPTTRTARAEVEVENSEGLLRPGMFVEVALLAERREAVTVVPRNAIAERGGRRVVFVVTGQRVAQREVVLGLGDDDVVEVREGVEPGERVVVQGLETLADGSGVRVSQ